MRPSARCVLSGILACVGLLLLTHAPGTAQLVPFRESASNKWGYRSPAGVVVIAPSFAGAGEFNAGRAPVQDERGFGVIDTSGVVIARIRTDSLTLTGDRIAAPPARCAGSIGDSFPSTALVCYMDELGLDSTAVGGLLRFSEETRGEGARALRILRAASGAVLFEQQGSDGFSRMVALPGVNPVTAAEWLRLLYPPRPTKMGCSETWSSGALVGGAFIEQRAGC